ncbi:MAG: type II toxin-antitoxin system PemK/MazF family toxin [Candidatus Heimdallarchaeota archaeon]|nr:type II toxin-antitoxin system PemK/MazF family toxin [Candidatus Heimdallarchaeota archaeon]
MNYEQRDIVLVPFPFTDLSTVKKRPVLVLSKTTDNELSEDLITCAITSKLSSSIHSLIIDNQNIDEGSLPVQSTILISKLFTIEKTLILNQIARLDEKTFENVKKLFCDLI